MNIPSATEFNNWSMKQKTQWISSETYGKYKGYTKEQGYFPVIIYDTIDVGIVYSVNSQGALYEATAMKAKEAFDILMRFATASEAILKASKLS